MVKEVREKEHNARAEDVRGINEEMSNMGMEMERARDEAGNDGAASASAKAKAHRLASDIDGVSEWSEGVEADQRDNVDRDEATAERERAGAKKPHNILEEEEGQRYRLIEKIQGFHRANDDFDWKMDDIGVQGDKRGRLVTSELNDLWGRFDSLRRYIEASRSAAEDKGRQADSLEKQCRSAEESILNLKSRDEAEGGSVRNLASGRHHGRGG